MIQHQMGRYFIHGHSLCAISWKQQAVQEVADLPGVERVSCDQCLLGAQIERVGAIRKPIGFMSNSQFISRRCEGRRGWCSRRLGGQHANCTAKELRRVAVYLFKLCHANLEGIRGQMRNYCHLHGDSHGLHCIEEENLVEYFAALLTMGSGGVDGEVFLDDITKQPLKAEMVHAAREKELEHFESKQGWVPRKICEAVSRTGRPLVTVRWVDVSKGDDASPNYRSRFVARQIRGPHEQSVFAPTRPLEALRTVKSLACCALPGDSVKSRDLLSEEKKQISLIDISRSYFNAKAGDANPAYVHFPREHRFGGDELFGLLRRHMYGTQRAAEGWQQEYSATLRRLGFQQRGGVAMFLFVHAENVSFAASMAAISHPQAPNHPSIGSRLSSNSRTSFQRAEGWDQDQRMARMLPC